MVPGGLPHDSKAIKSEVYSTLKLIKNDSSALIFKQVVHSGQPPPIYSFRAGPNNTFWRVPLDPEVARVIRTPMKVIIYLHIKHHYYNKPTN